MMEMRKQMLGNIRIVIYPRSLVTAALRILARAKNRSTTSYQSECADGPNRSAETTFEESEAVNIVTPPPLNEKR